MGWSEYFTDCWSTGSFTASPGFTENGLEKEKKSSEWQVCGQKCHADASGQREVAGLVTGDRKATVTQITSHHNQGMQKKISKHTTHGNLNQNGNSRRSHCVPLHWFLLQYSDGWVRKWRQKHESMDPSCFCHHCWPCLTLHDHSVLSPEITCYITSPTGFLNMTLSLLYSNHLHRHQISMHLWDVNPWFTSRMCSNCVMLAFQYLPKYWECFKHFVPYKTKN